MNSPATLNRSFHRRLRFEILRTLALRHHAALGATALGILMLDARWWWSGRFEFRFLLWNLFLAWIPLGLAEILALQASSRPDSTSRWRPDLFVIATAWLLFLPNAPYLLTDLLHWRPRGDAPPWFDLLLLLHFGLLGTALGFASIRIVRQQVLPSGARFLSALLVVVVLFLCSFGIYLGRFQRWNSWDLLTDPHSLLTDVLHRCLYPWQHPMTWGFTVAMTGVLLSLWCISLSYATADRVSVLDRPDPFPWRSGLAN